MAQVVDKKVEMRLVGLNGNAYALIGNFMMNAKRQGWTQEEIELVEAEATAGDYDHLLQTLMAHTRPPEVSHD